MACDAASSTIQNKDAISVASMQAIFHDKYLWLSLGFDCFTVSSALVVYYSVSYFTNLRYLQWAESLDVRYPNMRDNPLKDPLPDVILDRVPASWNRNNALGSAADVLPMVTLAIGLGTCVLLRYADLTNHVCMTFLFLAFWNGVVENVTVMPSSYGYDRCIEFLGLNDEVKYPDEPKSSYYGFTVSLSGTCTAMMWSGHTQQTMLGVYALLSGIERRWPTILLKKKIGKKYSGVSVKTIFVILAAIIEGVMLICNNGHYTADIIVGFLVTSLALSNGKIKYWCTRMNPFLKGHWILKTSVEKAKELDIVMTALEEYPAILHEIKTKLDKASPKPRVPEAETASSVHQGLPTPVI